MPFKFGFRISDEDFDQSSSNDQPLSQASDSLEEIPIVHRARALNLAVPSIEDCNFAPTVIDDKLSLFRIVTHGERSQFAEITETTDVVKGLLEGGFKVGAERVCVCDLTTLSGLGVHHRSIASAILYASRRGATEDAAAIVQDTDRHRPRLRSWVVRNRTAQSRSSRGRVSGSQR